MKLHAVSDEEQPVVYVPGISAEGNLRTRRILRAQKTEAKLKVPAAATTATMDPIREPTEQQVTNEGGMKSASLKDLCPEDKRRIANLIKELARVSEEKEVTEERLKAEQESFEKKIRQLEEQNELIIKEREDILFFPPKKECQELLSLYQKYLAEQQEKLSASLTELGAARQKEQQVSNKKSPCQPPCLELDGSYLGVARQQTLYKNSKASKSGSPTLVSVPRHCRNNHVHGTTAQYKREEVMDECLVGNGLQRKCNNMMSSTKQRSPHCKELAQDTAWGASEFQSVCPHQAGHCCAYREGGSSDNTHGGRQVSHVPRRHCGPQYEGCDYLRRSHVSGLNDSMDSGSKEMEHSKRLSEERRQQLLLQKLELEIEKERLQHLLAKQEAKLLLKQRQLHQSRLDYNSVETVHVQCDTAWPFTPSSMPTSKGEDYPPRTPTCNKASRSSAGSSSGKKTVGFSAAMEEGPLWMQTKEETSRSGKGTASGSRKDAATSPALTSSRKELVATATSPIQHDTSR
uniref:KIAA1328 n=1 Tax=Crocodylus porosus TaxID=8502 RepID=A0A7M4FEB4_CROPO